MEMAIDLMDLADAARWLALALGAAVWLTVGCRVARLGLADGRIIACVLHAPPRIRPALTLTLVETVAHFVLFWPAFVAWWCVRAAASWARRRLVK